MKGDIVFSSDIITSVSKKLDISERKVKHVFNFLFWFIKRKAREPEVFSINLPFIGRLYLATERLKRANREKEKKDQVSKRQKIGHKNAKDKIEIFERIFQKAADGKYLRSPHKKRSNLNDYFFTKGLTIQQLEAFQNEYER